MMCVLTSFAVESVQTREVRDAGVQKLLNSFRAEGIDERNPVLGEIIRVAAPPADVIENFPEAVLTALGYQDRDDLRDHGEFYRLLGGNHRNQALRTIILDSKKSTVDQQRFPLSLKVKYLEYAETSPVNEVLLSEKSNNVKENQVIIYSLSNCSESPLFFP